MIGKNIAALRKKHKLTQIEFAERVHVTQGAVSQWETGRTNPDTFQLIQIAKIFDVDLKELTGNEDMPSAVTFPGKVSQSKTNSENATYSQIKNVDMGNGESAVQLYNAADDGLQELEKFYRVLSSEQKQQALVYLKFLGQQNKE